MLGIVVIFGAIWPWKGSSILTPNRKQQQFFCSFVCVSAVLSAHVCWVIDFCGCHEVAKRFVFWLFCRLCLQCSETSKHCNFIVIILLFRLLWSVQKYGLSIFFADDDCGRVLVCFPLHILEPISVRKWVLKKIMQTGKTKQVLRMTQQVCKKGNARNATNWALGLWAP